MEFLRAPPALPIVFNIYVLHLLCLSQAWGIRFHSYADNSQHSCNHPHSRLIHSIRMICSKLGCAVASANYMENKNVSPTPRPKTIPCQLPSNLHPATAREFHSPGSHGTNLIVGFDANLTLDSKMGPLSASVSMRSDSCGH